MNNIDEILRVLEQDYRDTGCGLQFQSPFELLVATILSAQCTDVRVNQVTPALFQKYGTAQAMAQADEADVIALIRTCGFYKNKAHNIIAASKKIVSDFDGRVPDNMEDLQSLAGVGRKTANVVMANAFHQPAFAVDTHVFRVSNRLGLASAKDVLQTEEQLMAHVPREKWSDTHHYLIWHGRKVCSARKPACETCHLSPYCKYYQKTQKE